MSIVRVCGKTRHKDTPFLLLGVHLFAFLVVCKNYASTSLSCHIVYQIENGFRILILLNVLLPIRRFAA